MLLALDTSNDYAGVALWDDRGLRGEATWFAGRMHTEQVLPQADLLLRHLDVGPRDLTAVAVATGPGSWSGLRAGMSLAKALAIGRGLPLVGVPTLDALAHGRRGIGAPVAALVRLGRARYALGRYQPRDGCMQRQGDFELIGIGALVEAVAGMLVIGDLPPVLEGHGDGGVIAAYPAERQRRAAFVAELGWQRHRRSDHDDLVALEPMYLGSPVRE